MVNRATAKFAAWFVLEVVDGEFPDRHFATLARCRDIGWSPSCIGGLLYQEGFRRL